MDVAPSMAAMTSMYVTIPPVSTVICIQMPSSWSAVGRHPTFSCMQSMHMLPIVQTSMLADGCTRARGWLPISLLSEGMPSDCKLAANCQRSLLPSSTLTKTQN